MIVLMLFAVVVGTSALVGTQQELEHPSFEEVKLLTYHSQNDGLGNYKFKFEHSGGVQREEQGELVNSGVDKESISVKGSYSWRDSDGVTHFVYYVADDKGYRPIIGQHQDVPFGLPAPVIASLLGNG